MAREMEITNLPFIIIVMPEWFYLASSKDPGFRLKTCRNDGRFEAW